MGTSTQKNALRTREAIMNLLTDDEVTKVSEREEVRLVEGDEYVDLENLDAGVQRVQATPRTRPDNTLARSSVSDATWGKIVRALAS